MPLFVMFGMASTPDGLVSIGEAMVAANPEAVQAFLKDKFPGETFAVQVLEVVPEILAEAYGELRANAQ